MYKQTCHWPIRFLYLAFFICSSGCPAGWVRHGSSCYYIEDSKTFSMSVAQQKCRNFGADLAIIRSAEENDFILRLVTEKLNNAYGVWLGLQRKADSKLYWIDGTPLEGHYQNWDIREPNNSGGSENCVNMYRGGSPGKWNDAPCFWALTPSVLCQKSI